jgi:hypothetical protein
MVATSALQLFKLYLQCLVTTFNGQLFLQVNSLRESINWPMKSLTKQRGPRLRVCRNLPVFTLSNLFQVNIGSSRALEASLLNPNASYDSSSVMILLADEGRNENA